MTMATTPTDPDAASELVKVEAERAQEVLERYDASEAATALLGEGMTPRAFVDRLLADELFDDAISFLAYALPRREALWWGLECVRSVTPEEPPEAVAAALAAADAWIAEPADELRRAAFDAAEAATYGTPAGSLALAVFFSEGSLAPADCPAVPVGEWFCARTVAASLLLAALANGPEEASATAQGFAERGVAAANEPAPWEESA